MKKLAILSPIPPKVLIWDTGGVLVNYRNLWQDDEFISNCGCGSAEIGRFFKCRPFFDYEEGRIASPDFFDVLKKQLGYRFDFERFAVDFCECCRFELNREAFELFLAVKVKYADVMESWMLSNVNEIHYDHLRRKYPGLYANFWEIFLSFKMGSRKPDSAIYEKMRKLGGADYPDCLLVDDVWENGLVPKQYGMNFIHFKDLGQLRSALTAHGVKV